MKPISKEDPMWQIFLQLMMSHEVQVVFVVAGGIMLFLAVGIHTCFQFYTHSPYDPDFQIEEEEGQTE